MSIFEEYKSQPLWAKLLLIFFSICLLAATRNHAVDLINNGFLPYTKLWGVPSIFNLYWTMLTFVDPIGAVLIFFSVRKGLVLINIIMISDVAVNFYATYNFWNSSFLENGFLQLQLLFGVIVLIVTPVIIMNVSKQQEKT